MSKKIYVGNLSFSVNSDKLKEIFAAYGPESAEVIIFRDTGKSKGFGFVTITDDAQAEKAISELNGKEVEGRKLTVNEAKPFEPGSRPPRRNFGGGGFGGERRSGGFGGERRSFGGNSRRF